MYLNVQLGHFHIVLGKLAEQASQEKPVIMGINHTSEQDEFCLDDESKLRYEIQR